MAGSFLNIPPNDPFLGARIRSLASLADHLAEPVIIISPTLELVYANAPAQRMVEECPLLEQIQEEGGMITRRAQPCEGCPGKTVLELDPSCDGLQDGSFFHTEKTTCPLPKSRPLGGNIRDHIDCVLMMGKTGHETVALTQSLRASPYPEKTKTSQSPDIEGIIGKSAPMQQVLDTIRLVAASRVTVLLQGESGTGKELVAKAIHALSSRRQAPFVVVDCGTVPETLLESELFGHKRGAFTGAIADRKGLFEEADGGTIFLDEIGNTTPSFQAKLLRVLQENEIKAVGSSRTRKVDVRVIAASNIPLEDLIREKKFRTDLFYRLAVLPLSLPPLRERREDIPLLIHHFIQRSCEKHDLEPVDISFEAMERLVQRSWVGNVRELEHTIERLVLMAKGGLIQIHDLDHSAHRHPPSSNLRELGKTAQSKAEKDSIQRALREAKGNKVAAAKLLNISRATLYNKLKTYRIE